MNLQIDINEIEKVVLNLLRELRDREGDVVELEPVDYYWSIDAEEMYDPYNDPSNLTLGQLTEDLQDIKKIADCEVEPVSLDLVKVSAVLALLGRKTVW